MLVSIFLITFFGIAFSEKPQEIHCKHFFYGYPLGTAKTNDLIIRDIYALSNNDSTKFADWVAYRIDKKMLQGKVGNRDWKADPWLDDNETLEPNDYKNASENLKIDRGHQAPLANFKGSDYWYESNYLSNITPQNSELNRGLWKMLEDKERKILDSFEVIFVMTGPLYEKHYAVLPNADEYHKIPSGYWKIIIIPLNKNDFITFSFIFNQDANNSKILQDFLVTIDEIEKRSKLDFFWELDDKIEEKLEKLTNLERFTKFFNLR
jgi:endonuclease G